MLAQPGAAALFAPALDPLVLAETAPAAICAEARDAPVRAPPPSRPAAHAPHKGRGYLMLLCLYLVGISL